MSKRKNHQPFWVSLWVWVVCDESAASDGNDASAVSGSGDSDESGCDGPGVPDGGGHDGSVGAASDHSPRAASLSFRLWRSLECPIVAVTRPAAPPKLRRRTHSDGQPEH